MTFIVQYKEHKICLISFSTLSDVSIAYAYKSTIDNLWSIFSHWVGLFGSLSSTIGRVVGGVVGVSGVYIISGSSVSISIFFIENILLLNVLMTFYHQSRSKSAFLKEYKFSYQKFLPFFNYVIALQN